MSRHEEIGQDNLSSGEVFTAIYYYGDPLPHDITGYVGSGAAKQAYGDVDGAIADYSNAIGLDPNFAMAYYDRGCARETMGDVDGAIADYSKAIELNPNLAVAYYDRSGAKRAKGDIDGATADRNRAIELEPPLANLQSQTARNRNSK